MKHPTAPFAFPDSRKAEVHRLLSLLGPGPAAHWRDACMLMEDPRGLASVTHLVGHLFREIEGALRKVVAPVVHGQKLKGNDNHKQDIRKILSGLGVSPESPVTETWLGLAGEGNEYGLYKRAHRDNLNPPRVLNAEVRKFWSAFEDVLYVVMSGFESRYLDTLDELDILLSKPDPSAEDVKTLLQSVPNNPLSLGYFYQRLDDPNWLPL